MPAIVRGSARRRGQAGDSRVGACAGNACALAFYAAQGFEDIGETRHVFERRSFENRVLVRRMPPQA